MSLTFAVATARPLFELKPFLLVGIFVHVLTRACNAFNRDG